MQEKVVPPLGYHFYMKTHHGKLHAKGRRGRERAETANRRPK